MNTNLATIQVDDGWDDAAAENAERVIKGTLLKFSDWHWFRGKESIQVENGTVLVAVSTAAAWVKWSGGKPAEYMMREPGKKLPDREELSDQEGCGTWEAGLDGELKDPWQNTRFVYLVDPKTAEAYTFSTSSWGGRAAVSDLAEQIQRMRFANPNASPLVELDAAPMQTKFGKKSRPFFKVTDWRGLGRTEAPALALVESKTSTPAGRAMDDEIPF